MKLPSLTLLRNDALGALRRFPWTLAYGLVTAVLSVWQIEHHDRETRELVRLTLLTGLGMPLSFGAALLTERIRKVPGSLVQLSAVILLAAYYVLWRGDDSTHTFIRYGQLSIAAGLFVTFAAFWVRGEINGFWQFNRALFIRGFFSGVYSLILGLGLFSIVGSLNYLFNLNIHEEIYPDIWVSVWLVFAPWVFLSRVPSDPADLEKDGRYPGALKSLAQYLLLPLVNVYLLVLYAYMIKIIATRHFPDGIVTWMVWAMAIAGSLAWVLIYPVQKEKGNRWITAYARYFYIALLPLLVMGGVAIAKRISAYGITENRYFLVVLTAWMFCLAVYFAFSKIKNIKVLPMSLALIGLLTAFGPWGAFSVSASDQLKRLESILTRYHFLVDGVLVRVKQDPGIEVRQEMSSILDYLAEHYGVGILNGRYSKEGAVRLNLPEDKRGRAGQVVMEELGQRYVDRMVIRNKGRFSYAAAEHGVMKIGGYDHAFSIRNASKNDPVGLSAVRQAGQLIVQRDGRGLVSVDLIPFLERIKREYSRENRKLDQEILSLTAENARCRVKIYIHGIGGRTDEQDGFRVDWLNSTVLLKINR